MAVLRNAEHSDVYDDYFTSGRDNYTLVRAKCAWVPEWLWWVAAHTDRHGDWLAHWLSEVPRG